MTTKKRFWLSFQVGCTYIGTVVGAGFASGQEVFQFFGRFGYSGVAAICLATVLFASLGYKIMWLGNRLRARSYRELNAHLFGPKVGAVADVVLIIMLFGVTVAMIAGAGQLFHERMNVSFQVGAIATMIVTYLTLLRGMDGILKANSLIVPMMISFVLYAAYRTWQTYGMQSSNASSQVLSVHNMLIPLLSSLLYAAFNIGLAAGVLLPLGCDIEDQGVLRLGAIFGAAGLGVMLVAVMFTLLSHFPIAMGFGVPMAYVATKLGSVVQWIFMFVLWGEIYSTLVGDVYAIAVQFGADHGRKRVWFGVALLFFAYLFSQVGFAPIVKYAYTSFGFVSTMLVLALIWPRNRLPGM